MGAGFCSHQRHSQQMGAIRCGRLRYDRPERWLGRLGSRGRSAGGETVLWAVAGGIGKPQKGGSRFEVGQDGAVSGPVRPLRPPALVDRTPGAAAPVPRRRRAVSAEGPVRGYGMRGTVPPAWPHRRVGRAGADGWDGCAAGSESIKPNPRCGRGGGSGELVRRCGGGAECLRGGRAGPVILWILWNEKRTRWRRFLRVLVEVRCGSSSTFQCRAERSLPRTRHWNVELRLVPALPLI